MSDPSAELVACIPRLRRYARALVGDRGGPSELLLGEAQRLAARTDRLAQSAVGSVGGPSGLLAHRAPVTAGRRLAPAGGMTLRE